MSEERHLLLVKVKAAQLQVAQAKDALRAFDEAELTKGVVTIQANRLFVRRSDVWECKVCGYYAEERSDINHAADCPLSS